MRTTLEKHFALIGARLEVCHEPAAPDYRFDVVRGRRGEYFELRGSRIDGLVVQHVDKRSRHILVRGSERGELGQARVDERQPRQAAQPQVSRFLCGYDERHWFVAGIGDPVTTVRDAKLSLAPAGLREAVARERHRERRHNGLFTRQGEWFFVPAKLRTLAGWTPIHRNEPITRGLGKSHWCEELIRLGGVTVRLYQGREIDDAEFAELIAKNPKLAYRSRTRDAVVYVRGRVRHDDHATIRLPEWHRVYLNSEFTTGRVTFYD
jgi:hypothetical protein